MATVVGTSGDDVLQPGPGDQTAFLLNGDDQFIWNPGDGNDTVFGGGGTDTSSQIPEIPERVAPGLEGSARGGCAEGQKT